MTGNIIGILAFFGAIVISTQVYVNAMRNADRNIFEMNTFRPRMEEVRYIDRKLRDQSSRIGRELGRRLDITMRRVEILSTRLAFCSSA